MKAADIVAAIYMHPAAIVKAKSEEDGIDRVFDPLSGLDCDRQAREQEGKDRQERIAVARTIRDVDTAVKRLREIDAGCEG